MIDSEPLSFRAWREIVRAHGGELSPSEYGPMIGMDNRQAAALIASKLPQPADPAELDAEHWRRMIEFVEAEGRPEPGLMPLLRELEDRGLRLGVASNSPLHYVRAALAALGLEGRFGSVRSAQSVARSKPAPDVFLAVAEDLAVAPAACLAVEDSPAGLAAARAAGMRTVAIPNRQLGRDDFRGADHIFPSLEAFRRRLAEVLAASQEASAP